jgi:hypothetical protein
MIREAAGSRLARDYLRDACRDDALFYINSFAWTYNPRLREDKVLPFITYPFQDHAIREIESAIDAPRDIVIYKSRDTGASWICLTVFEHRWHFLRDQTFLCLSRNEAAVDKANNEDSLFPKIDRIHKRLPVWMMPDGWNARKHRNELVFYNPEMDSTINGCATVGDAAVGGRRTAILLDEFSRVEEGHEIDLGTADVSDCRIFNFTAYGKDNAAYELLQNQYKKKLCLHWSMDPRKNRKMYRWDGELQKFRYWRWDDGRHELVECPPHQYGPADADVRNFDPPGRPFEPVRDGVLRSPVYDMEDTRRGSRKYMAINWDIDFTGSDDRFFDLKMILEHARELATPPVWEGEIEVDQPIGEILGLRPKEGGSLRLWFDPDEGWPKSESGFACGVDPSRGKGASNSCASFADVDNGQKVAEYVTPYEPPEQFASKVVAICKLLRSHGGSTTFLAWERVGPGEDFRTAVSDMGYFNVYYDGVNRGDEIKPGRQPGWVPNRQSISALLGEYEMALRQRRFINRSKPALEECERFVNTPQGVKYISSSRTIWVGSNDDDASGASEAHGDRVRADALCNRAIRQQGGGTGSDLTKDKEPDPESVPWTMAGRRAIGKRLEREMESAWG